MNSNPKIIKVSIAVVIMLGLSLWVFNMVRPQTYEGVNLEFPINKGIVQVTNSADALQAQVISETIQIFRVSSPSDDISGSSVRQEIEGRRIEVFEFMLPTGMSEFTVTGNEGIRFEAETTTSLTATVYPLTVATMWIRIVILIAVILVGLFYISSLYDHLWLSAERRQDAKDDMLAQEAEQDNFNRIRKNTVSKKRP